MGADTVLRIVLASHPAGGDHAATAVESIDAQVVTRVRILPFGHDECAAYVNHRLTIAGGAQITFMPRAIDVLFGMSGGEPRLVNLICERALHEAAEMELRRIEPS